MKEKSIEQKIELEIAKNRYSGIPTPKLVDVAATNPHISAFFKTISHKPILKRLLFLHRKDLFGSDSTGNIPYLRLCTMPPKMLRKKGESPIAKTLQHIISTETEAVEHRSEKFLKSTLGIENNVSDLQQVLTYFLVDFIRQHPALTKLIAAPNFNYAAMYKELGEGITLDMLINYGNQILFNYNKPEIIDPIISRKAEELILEVVRNVMSKADQSLEQVSNLVPDIMMLAHQSSIVWIANLLNKINASHEDYIETLDDLYLFKLIDTRHIITWCPSCSSENPTFSQSIAKVAPKKFTSSRKCLGCGRKESFSVMFGIDSALKDMLYSMDGLLAVYFQWLLKQSNIIYESGTYASDYETDVTINGSTIVEIKTLQADRSSESLQSAIDKAISQLKKQIKNLENIKSANVLVNTFFLEQDLKNELLKKHRDFSRQYNLQIVCTSELESFVKGLPKIK